MLFFMGHRVYFIFYDMIRVLIVDDHRIVIDGLKLLLQQVGNVVVVATVSDGLEALQVLEQENIDVVLLDINMPKLNGIETSKRIKEKYQDTDVIALTMIQEASMIRKMLKAGAAGYLMKNVGKEELIKAIYSVHEGNNYYASEVSDIIFQDLQGEQKKSKSLYPQLSRREKQILKMILDELTTGEIAEKLHISFGTVETHRRNIMNKLGARNTAGMVRIALENRLLD